MPCKVDELTFTRYGKHILSSVSELIWVIAAHTTCIVCLKSLAEPRIAVGMEPFSATSTSQPIGAVTPRAQTCSWNVQHVVPWRLRSHAAAEHSARQTGRTTRLQVVADRVTPQTSMEATIQANQSVREGQYESSLVTEQVQFHTDRIPPQHRQQGQRHSACIVFNDAT